VVHGPVREVVRGPGPLDWSTDRGSVFSGHPNINIKGYTMTNIRGPEWTNILTFASYYWPIELTRNENHANNNWFRCDCHPPWNVLPKKNLNIRMYAHVTSRKPAQQANNHMLVMVNFFDSIQCIVMFPCNGELE